MPKIKRTSKSNKYVPYAKGFHPPTSKQQQAAIGTADFIQRELQPVPKAFSPIPKCTSIDDWLAQYNEEGQTFSQFLDECPWLSRRKRKTIKQKFMGSGKNIREKYPDGKIYIVPVGEFSSSNSPGFEALRQYAEIFLGIPVRSLPAISLKFQNNSVYWEPTEEELNSHSQRTSSRVTKYKLNSRHDPASGRYQLCIDTVLLRLRGVMPDDALCMIGLTMSDLYCDDTDLFVAGMAGGNHRVAIFSFYRYDPNMTFSTEFWHEVQVTGTRGSEEERRKLILSRSCKLLVHEICHLLGIDHCIYYSCCMNGSGHLQEDFRQPMFLCPVDLHKLKHLVGFSVLHRYRQLLAFFAEQGMQEEADWLQQRISFIQDCQVCQLRKVQTTNNQDGEPVINA